MTRICRRIQLKGYLKHEHIDPKTGQTITNYKKVYRQPVYYICFPSGFLVSDLVGRNVRFTRNGNNKITLVVVEDDKDRPNKPSP